MRTKYPSPMVMSMNNAECWCTEIWPRNDVSWPQEIGFNNDHCDEGIHEYMQGAKSRENWPRIKHTKIPGSQWSIAHLSNTYLK